MGLRHFIPSGAISMLTTANTDNPLLYITAPTQRRLTIESLRISMSSTTFTDPPSIAKVCYISGRSGGAAVTPVNINSSDAEVALAAGAGVAGTVYSGSSTMTATVGNVMDRDLIYHNGKVVFGSGVGRPLHIPAGTVVGVVITSGARVTSGVKCEANMIVKEGGFRIQCPGTQYLTMAASKFIPIFKIIVKTGTRIEIESIDVHYATGSSADPPARLALCTAYTDGGTARTFGTTITPKKIVSSDPETIQTGVTECNNTSAANGATAPTTITGSWYIPPNMPRTILPPPDRPIELVNAGTYYLGLETSTITTGATASLSCIINE